MKQGPIRARALVAIAVVALIGASQRSTVAQAAQNLFPAGKGTSWDYSGSVGDRPLKMKAEITSFVKAAKETTVVMRWLLNDQPMQDETYLITADSVSRARSGAYGSNVLNPPLPVIKYPMSVGKTWDWNGSLTTAGGQATFKATAKLNVAAMETVKIGDKSVSAYRVNMSLVVTQGEQNVSIPATYWFAPGAGMVKQSATLPTPDGKSVTIEATATKYTIK